LFSKFLVVFSSKYITELKLRCARIFWGWLYNTQLWILPSTSFLFWKR